MTQNKANESKSGKKTTSKQIVALIGIVLLVALYLFTLIAALFDHSGTMVLFRASLIGTFTIPLLIWVYIWMYGKLTNKHTMADFDLNINASAEDKK